MFFKKTILRLKFDGSFKLNYKLRTFLFKLKLWRKINLTKLKITLEIRGKIFIIKLF